MFKTIGTKVVCAVASLVLIGCGWCPGHNMEKTFFHGFPPQNRLERFRQYPLEDQYKIFRYGADCIEPPQMVFADPIAERGAAAVPFLLTQLQANPDDATVR